MAPDASGPLAQFALGETGVRGAAIRGDPAFFRAGGLPKPETWQAPPQGAFDWAERGSSNDHLKIDLGAGTATVDWGTGQLTISGIAATPAPQDAPFNYAPAAVADVTGDGRLDLIVFSNNTAAVIAGQGKETPSRTVAFSELGKSPIEWVSPPTVLPVDSRGSTQRMPFGAGGIIVPLWDITGDGVPDFSVDLPGTRSAGATTYYAGKPCKAN